MTKEQLISKIQRVNGLKIIDPWGDMAKVSHLDGDHVWLIYEGLDVPFRRSIEGCVRAANGTPIADKRNQFLKRIPLPSGMTIELIYEPFWCQTEGASVPRSQPTLESLQAKKRLSRK